MPNYAWCDRCGDFFPVDDHFHEEDDDDGSEVDVAADVYARHEDDVYISDAPEGEYPQTGLAILELQEARQRAAQAFYNLLRKRLKGLRLGPGYGYHLE